MKNHPKKLIALTIAGILLLGNTVSAVSPAKQKGRYTDMSENYWGYENIEACVALI